MPAPREILELIARFEQQLDAYKSGAYNETQVRREFLDPFFKALGWDMDNEQGFAEAYKDVVHEDAIRMGGATKAPDSMSARCPIWATTSSAAIRSSARIFTSKANSRC
jgi:hypothetical protein